jgi:hypothetical protein
MAPLAEKDEIVVFGRVWRRAGVAPAVTAEREAIEQREAARELPVRERAAVCGRTGSSGAVTPGSGGTGTERPG